ncbi:hypothetical protein CCPUN_04340 [Cardinium endosymbiont of Culicoides punctatus]|nr:hypothetical protein CCPUN_04340 [Cardinium endosymbiont of Culicoides punctatus]
MVAMTTMNTLSYVLNSGCCMKAQHMNGGEVNTSTVSTNTVGTQTDYTVTNNTVGTQTSDPNKEKPFVHVTVDSKDITLLQDTLKDPNITPEIINAVNPENGQTALHSAIFSDWIEGAKSLLQHKDIDTRIGDSDGNTVLHLVILKIQQMLQEQKPEDFPQLVQLRELIHKKLTSLDNTHEKNKEGNTPLHLLAAMMPSNKVSVEVVAEITTGFLSTALPPNLEYGLIAHDFNSQNKDGDTPLHVALKNNNLSLAKKLIEFLKPRSIALDLQNKNGDTPLGIALKKNEQEQNKQDIQSIIEQLCS